MPRYTFGELKERAASSGNTKHRQLEPELGIRYKLWIPFEDFLYKRVHYEIKKRTPFKSTRFDTLDCLNQEFGEKGKGCPICETIEDLWDIWKDADKEKDDKKKKAIQNQINQIVAEYFYMNVINLSDPEKKFIILKLTKSKMMDMQAKVQEHNDNRDKESDPVVTISDIIWRYKKSEKNGRTKYEVIDDLALDETSKLKKELKKLADRSYEDGGPIDLDQMDSRKARTPEEFAEVLGEPSGSSGSGKTGSPKVETEDLSDVEEDSEQISLDDIADDSTKTDKEKTSDKDSSGEESLEKDDIELNDLEEEELVEVTAKEFAEKYKAKEHNYCLAVYRHLLSKKKVKEVSGVKDMATAAFEYLKKEKKIEMSKKELADELDVPM